MENAKKHFLNTLELLDSRSIEEIPEGSEGLSVNQIRGIIMADLETLENL